MKSDKDIRKDDTAGLNIASGQTAGLVLSDSVITDDTHIRISKKVYKKFRRVGVYGESADGILDSLIDFYFDNKDKPGVSKRKIKNREREKE